MIATARLRGTFPSPSFLAAAIVPRCYSKKRAARAMVALPNEAGEATLQKNKYPEKRLRALDQLQLTLDRYAELGIDRKLYEQAGGARFRQHVNPLKRELQVPADPVDWSATYDDPTLPLIIDIGAGYGRFLLALLNVMPGFNGLGLEIRSTVVDRANRWAEGMGLDRRAQFVLANATVSLSPMMQGCPAPVQLVTIQYPDPHFKKRHHKRRVVQASLVAAVRDVLQPGGRLFLQSDVLEVAEDMRDRFQREAGKAFTLAAEHAEPGAVFHAASPAEENGEGGAAVEQQEEEWKGAWAAGGWLKENPLPVPTERELHVLGQGLPVYRVMLVRRAC